MALGGGVYLTQNKVLPGTYINFISAARASAELSDRGYIAMPLELDWGEDDTIFTVDSGELQKNSMAIFGYDYTSDKLKEIREIFKNAKTLYAYRLNSGVQASSNIGKAKYTGIRGNSISIEISVNADEASLYDVETFFDGNLIDSQTVANVAELENNDYVIWDKKAALSGNQTFTMTGGTNKNAVEGADYQKFLDKIEAYSFNTLGCPSMTEQIIDLFVAFTKRMRDENGIKFQTVVYRKQADYEGIISVENKVIDKEAKENALIYWVAGAEAGCDVNKSNTNKIYDGEYTIDVNYKQSQLEDGIRKGKFMFHKVGDTIRVLDDINTFISVTVEKNIDFNSNQVMRVLDQIGNDIAVLFNTKYLGKVQNNSAGRMAFWNDIVSYNKELEGIQAIEDFIAEDVIVSAGNDKKSVIVSNAVKPVNAMTKLYMTVIVE